MAQSTSTKFGMFGGVFTPSILTILGVIMYLRLPWLVGSAGLTMALVVICAAHLISVSTGLSISSIATDKKVGAGGPYYIVSRSLGLPIGGTLGLALFIGLSFSISLYVIGFIESALPFFAGLDIVKANWEIPLEGEGLKNATRVSGTIVLTLLAVITMISTSLTIKTQYFILLAIALSLVSIFVGNDAIAAPVDLDFGASEGAASFAVFFGIFFPAVTGFTAGVNMSGDLADPKRAIPRGTMMAIGVGFLVYVGLAVFLAFNVDPQLLRDDTKILVTASWIGGLVFAGIWGATISSALGSLLGAPRILQALANDGVMPRFLGKGAGPSEEPRRALMVALIIAEGGILIGELDAIARVVSIFFIATYGFLNISAAIEAWASSDFHPDFKIPKTVSVIGAISCVVVMVLLDLIATMGALVLFAAAFTVLKRRELTLESGDTWEGVWSSLVRAGVERLQHVKRLERNWRPNVLAIPTVENAAPVLEFGETLIRDRGVLTAVDFSPAQGDGLDDRAVGVFKKRVNAKTAEERTQASLAAVRFHGFAGLEPNTVMLDWRGRADSPQGFQELIQEAREQDYNVLALAPDEERGFGKGRRIDVWWQQGRGAIGLCINLIRFLRAADTWRGAELRFIFVTDETTAADTLMKSTQRLLEHARVQAEVKVIDNGMANRRFESWVEKESAEADLVVLGLPPEDASEEELQRVDAMLRTIGTALFVRASSAFQDSFGGERRSRKAAVREELDAELPEVEYPEQEDLEKAARALHLPLEECAARFAEDCLQSVVLQTGGLLEGVSASLMKELSTLEKEVERFEAPRHGKALVRARSAALFQAQRLLDEYEASAEARADVVERQLELLRERLAELHDASSWRIHVLRDKDDLAPRPEDSPAVRRAKAQLRRRNFFRKAAAYTVDTSWLYRALLEEGMPTLTRDVLHDAASRTFQTVLDLGRELEDLRRRLAELGEGEGGIDPEVVRAERDRALEVLSGLADRNYTVLARAKRDMVGGARDLVRGYIEDISAFDYKARIRAKKRADRSAVVVGSALAEAARVWAQNERLLIGRVSLTLQSASISLRLTTIVRKSRDALVRQLSEGAAGRLRSIQKTLQAFLDDESDQDASALKLVVESAAELDDKALVDDLVAEMQRAAANLPESFDTLSDESILAIREAPFAQVDTLHVSLRRLAEFLIVGEFSEALGRELSELPSREQRAVEVAKDVARLVSLHAYEDEVSLDGHPVDDDDEAEGTDSVVRGALQRVTAELESLDELRRRAAERFDTHLRRVLDRTDAYAISGSEEGVRPYVRRERSAKALSRVARSVQRVRFGIRDNLVALLYRKSRGQLLARRLRSDAHPENVVERTLGLVASVSPPAAVLSGLPFHYRQLFLGQTRISNEFWVGRADELAEAARAVSRFRAGTRGAIFVTGPRGSGKTALTREIAARSFRSDNVHHVFPPLEGSVDVARFNTRVASELGGRGEELERTIANLEGNVVVCLHDLELWWRRAGDGLSVIEHVARLIERYGDRCLFVVNLGEHALRFISKLTPLAEHALAVIRCGPVDAEALKEIVLRRHRSTGLSFIHKGNPEDQLAPWEEAQLFSKLFDHTAGSIGAAMHAWIAHVERVEGETLTVRPAKPIVADVLSELRIEWVALLVQLLLHRRASLPRMQAITGLSLSELERDLATLARMGLVSELKPNVFELNRWAAPMIARHLEARRVLL